MATTYHDWAEQTTASARLTRLRLHITEVSAQLGAPDVSADGKSKSLASLNQYYTGLLSQLAILERDPGTRRAGGRSLYRASTG